MVVGQKVYFGWGLTIYDTLFSILPPHNETDFQRSLLFFVRYLDLEVTLIAIMV